MTDFKTNEYGIVYSGKEHSMSGKIKNSWDAKYDGPNFIGYTATDSVGRKSNGTVKLNDKGDAINENYSYYYFIFHDRKRGLPCAQRACDDFPPRQHRGGLSGQGPLALRRCRRCALVTLL